MRTSIIRSLTIATLPIVLLASCDVPPDEPGTPAEVEKTSSAVVVGAETPLRTRNMMLLAKAAICGPAIWGPGVDGHAFEALQATVNVFGPNTAFVAGELRHILRLRPDDRINYTIKYEGGMPKDPNIQITRGGVAAWFKVIANAIILVGFDKVTIGTKTHTLHPEKLPDIATGIAEIVEGRGWEAQAAAVINLIGLYAMQGTMICGMTIL